MKNFILLIVFLTVGSAAFAQGAQAYFNQSANYYVGGKNAEALRAIGEGLQKYPGDPKLSALQKKLKEEQKQKDQQKQDQQKDQQKKEQEKKEQEKKDQQQKQDQEKKDQEQKDQQQKDS